LSQNFIFPEVQKGSISFFDIFFDELVYFHLYLFLRAPVRMLGTFWCLWCRGFQPANVQTTIDYTRTTFKK